MKWMITGGAGFIGVNAAARLLRMGYDVGVLDDLSRPGARENLQWLQGQGKFEFHRVDVTNAEDVESAFRAGSAADVVLHLAAQVAVTTSVVDPRRDFQVNALGTFNVLEVVRRFLPEAIVLNASTNKVYGGMEDVKVIERNGRYEYASLPDGVGEDRPLDFHSPYGCSKGAADQYVRDYARIYGLRTVNFRQSCIYGPRQFGIEDQGWVAWFTIAAVLGRPLMIYGDGRQVRDLLYVDDLVECYLAAVQRIGQVAGQCYNVGGGPANALSLLEVLGMLERLLDRPVVYTFSDWRPGDQRVFVADITKARMDLGWVPVTARHQGIERLVAWVTTNRNLFGESL